MKGWQRVIGFIVFWMAVGAVGSAIFAAALGQFTSAIGPGLGGVVVALVASIVMLGTAKESSGSTSTVAKVHTARATAAHQFANTAQPTMLATSPTPIAPLTAAPFPTSRASGSRAVSVVLKLVAVIVCVAAGFFASAPFAFNGYARFGAIAGEAPQRLTGGVHGMWDSAVLGVDLDALTKELNGRELQSLHIHPGHYSADVLSETDPEGVDVYLFYGRTLDEFSTSVLNSFSPRLFTMDEVSAEAIRAAVEHVYADTPDADVRMVSVATYSGGLRIGVSVQEKYDYIIREFDLETGAEILD